MATSTKLLGDVDEHYALGLFSFAGPRARPIIGIAEKATIDLYLLAARSTRLAVKVLP